MHRHQTCGLFLKPSIGLLFIAVGTVSIATRSSHPVLSATSLAFIVDVPEVTGSAPRDRADHFAVADWNIVTKLLEVGRCVLPKAVRNRWHRLSRLPPEQLLDRFACIHRGGVRQMEIDHRGLQTAVSHVLLDHTQADSGFQQVRGVGMAQGM